MYYWSKNNIILTCMWNLFQHLHEILDMDMNALDWMMRKFPEIKEREEMRKIIGRYGLSGQQQVGGWQFDQFVWFFIPNS